MQTQESWGMSIFNASRAKKKKEGEEGREKGGPITEAGKESQWGLGHRRGEKHKTTGGVWTLKGSKKKIWTLIGLKKKRKKDGMVPKKE